jgi:hypothetical protein
MTLYNNTNIGNLSSVNDLLVLLNTNTNNAFWAGMYWLVMTIVLFSSLVFGFEVAIILTFFTGLLTGIMLLYLGLINITIFAMTEGLLLFFVLYLIYTTNKSN